MPAILDYVKSEDGRKIVQTGVFDYGAIARPYVFPPGTPKDRVAMLRKGLADTYKDPEFLADAKKARLDMSPLSGEEMEKDRRSYLQARSESGGEAKRHSQLKAKGHGMPCPFVSISSAFFVFSFENGIREGSLTSFEMTRIVIPNECAESFPSIFTLCGRVQLMKHFVVNRS